MKRVSDNSTDGFSRRRFLANASAVGAIPLLGLPRMAAAEPPPEIRKIRLFSAPVICTAPQFLAEELLHLEGFSEVEYVTSESGESGLNILGEGRADMTMWNVPSLEVLNSVPFNRWREVHPEDTVRFFALRLHEVGIIKATPQKIIAQGTDWRFLSELKRELKA